MENEIKEFFRQTAPKPADPTSFTLELNARLAAVMKQRAFEVRVDLGMGRFSDAVYTSDLSHGYVSINADYTT